MPSAASGGRDGWEQWRDHMCRIHSEYVDQRPEVGSAMDVAADFTEGLASELPHHDRHAMKLRTVSRQLAGALRRHRRAMDKLQRAMTDALEAADRFLDGEGADG